MGFLIQMFSGKDNKSADIGRVIWFEAVQAYVILTVYYIYHGVGVFDPVAWGGGLAAIIGAGGAALGMKGNVEPAPADAARPPAPEVAVVAVADVSPAFFARELDADGFPKVITKKDREAGR